MTQQPAHEPPQLSPNQPQWSDDGTRWWDGAAWVPKDEAPGRQEELAREQEAELQRAQAHYAQEYAAWQQQTATVPASLDAFVPGVGTPPPPPPGLLLVPEVELGPKPTGYALGYWSFLAAAIGVIAWGIGGLAAVILGHLSRRQAKRARLSPNIWSRWGLFFGYLELTLVAAAIGVVIWAVTSIDHTPVGQSLKGAAQAQQYYHSAYDTYARSATELAPTHWAPEPGVTVTVEQASATSYCLRGQQGSIVLWLSSGSGKVSHTSCR
jgi:hypothetical protein